MLPRWPKGRDFVPRSDMLNREEAARRGAETHHEVVNTAKRPSVNSVLRMRHMQTAQDAFSCFLMS